MNISWTNLNGEENTAAVDANLWPIIDVLGMHDAAEFLLYFRGRYLYVNKGKSQERSPVSKLFGVEKAGKLSEALTKAGYGQQHGKNYKVPGATAFLSRYLRSKDLKINEIAHRLGASDITIRNHLKSGLERQRQKELSRKKRLDAAIEDAVALGLVVRVEQPKKKASR